MNGIVFSALAYAIGMPILFSLIGFLQKKLVTDRAIKRARKRGGRIDEKEIPSPKMPVWKHHLSFTFKDKRKFSKVSLKRNMLFWLLWLGGLLFAIIATLTPFTLQLLLLAFSIFFSAIIYGVKQCAALLAAREIVLQKMGMIASAKLGHDKTATTNPSAICKVLEWQDEIVPIKVVFNLLPSFPDSGEQAFVQQFNEIFGPQDDGDALAYVIDDSREKKDKKGNTIKLPGWCRSEERVYLKSVPPLPGRAMWQSHYIEHPAVAWSFFPIGLGVENGLALPNENGEIEHVLGYDVSGEQGDFAKEHGVELGAEVAASPQTLIGGATGGGKSVVQRNIIFSCIMRQDHWTFFGIDLKRVELSSFVKYGGVVGGIAVTLHDALEILRFAQGNMMLRYSQMEEIGVNSFLSLPVRDKALLIMVDEAGELLSASGVKSLGVSTPVRLASGELSTIGAIEIDDVILDEFNVPTTVTDKYKPEDQSAYWITVQNEQGVCEEFLAGAEHNWPIYFKYEDGTYSETEEIITTELLHNFMVNGTAKADLLLKREFPQQLFTITSIEKVENNTEELYCISVDSPSKQFLIGELDIPTHNTDEGKEEDALKGEAQMILGSIARLGRAAGVFMVVATQRPDATLLPGETKANLTNRINAGRTSSTASSMILENGEGTRVKGNPRGRLYVSSHFVGNHGQGFFESQKWIDDWLENKGLDCNGDPLPESARKKTEVIEEPMDEDTQDDLDSMLENEEIEDEDTFTYEVDMSQFEDDEEEDDGSPKTFDKWQGFSKKEKSAKSKGWLTPADEWDDDGGLLDAIQEENFS